MKKFALTLCLLVAVSYAQHGNFHLTAFIQKNHSNTEQVQFFVDAEKNQLQEFLRTHNGYVKYSFGKYSAVSLPANQVQQLANQKFVRHIEITAQHPATLNDTMRVRNHINEIQTGMAPLPKGYTGKGVIVGFIDTGIDFNHPDFQDSSGNTRVLRIWDQTQPVNGFTPAQYGYGQVYDSAYINSGSCPHTDATAHGTTVAGTACGNGLSTGTHWGGAPDSWIIMVETNESAMNWSATVADAVDYIYKVADSLGMPCVINASVGDYYGSHDGLDVPAQFMDSLVKAKRGRLFVCAGGNSGELPNYHLGYTVTSDTNFTWMRYHPLNSSSAFPYGVVFFESWSDSIDAVNMQFSIGADQISPTYKFRGETPWHGITDMLNTVVTDTIFSPNNDIIGIVDYYSEYSFGRYMLQVHMQEPDSNTYRFRFSTTGSGRFDIWSDEWLGISNMVSTGLPTVAAFPDIANYQTPDSSKIIVSGFSCMPSAITVANYNNIQVYNSLAGPINLGGVENEIAPSSSRGPTRDNRIKPEISATGNVTFSPAPLFVCSVYVASFPDRILPDSMHVRNGGTSMASPVVAGIAALMLERCPTLRWDEFIDAMVNTAYTDGFTGAVPNMSYGYGKTNAFGAMQQTLINASVTGNTEYCAGDSSLLTASCTCSQYTWSNSDTSLSSYFLQGPGWMLASNDAGCKSDTILFNIVENPLPDTSWFEIFTGMSDTLMAAVTGLNYQWYYNGSPIPGANQHFYVVTSSPEFGYYSLEVTDSNGCSLMSAQNWIEWEGIEENALHYFSVYPVPANDQLIIESLSQQPFTWQLYTINGQLLSNVNEPGIYYRVNTAALATGLYVLKLDVNDFSYYRKIEITR